MKFLTDKWEDEPRQLTDFSKLMIMICTVALAIFGSIKLVNYVDSIEQQELEMQYYDTANVGN